MWGTAQGVLSEVGKASSGKLFPLLLQLLKENARLGGAAGGAAAAAASADPATPVPAQVPRSEAGGMPLLACRCCQPLCRRMLCRALPCAAAARRALGMQASARRQMRGRRQAGVPR